MRFLTTAALCIPLLAAPSARAEEPEATAPGCTVRRTATDAEGIATFVSECHWAVAAELVERVFLDRALLAGFNPNLESIDLGDGRTINVHSVGFPIADRQSTLENSREPLPGGGLRSRYWESTRQAPLAKGRVQVRIDAGSWEIRPSANGGTALHYEMRYDPGGNLEPWIVRRFQAKGIANSLDGLRRAAEALAKRATPGTETAPLTSE